MIDCGYVDYRTVLISRAISTFAGSKRSCETAYQLPKLAFSWPAKAAGRAFDPVIQGGNDNPTSVARQDLRGSRFCGAGVSPAQKDRLPPRKNAGETPAPQEVRQFPVANAFRLENMPHEMRHHPL